MIPMQSSPPDDADPVKGFYEAAAAEVQSWTDLDIRAGLAMEGHPGRDEAYAAAIAAEALARGIVLAGFLDKAADAALQCSCGTDDDRSARFRLPHLGWCELAPAPLENPEGDRLGWTAGSLKPLPPRLGSEAWWALVDSGDRDQIINLLRHNWPEDKRAASTLASRILGALAPS